MASWTSSTNSLAAGSAARTAGPSRMTCRARRGPTCLISRRSATPGMGCGEAQVRVGGGHYVVEYQQELGAAADGVGVG
ncbi:hypothetical protein ABT061_32060 [Streptosporangium sp. NPDC002544]|uniref:hypothetical protein n=1 Tax=Streptosporangium sp. NPDC002544 TaxID=3154538 RepID=UPI003330DDB2